MKRVVITGATSIIGISLIKRLICENIEVTAIVRPNSDRIGLLPRSILLNIIECDLNNLRMANVKANNNFDIFFHLGWDSKYENSRHNVYGQLRNVFYTIEAVELAHKLGCSVFVGAGSQAEYGRVSDSLSPLSLEKPENAY